MSRNLLHKIALGHPLTSSEEAMKDKGVNDFARKMGPVEDLAETLRQDSAPQDARSRILSVSVQSPTQNRFKTLAVAGAALLILAAPLGVLMTNDMMAKSEDRSVLNQSKENRSTFYRLDTYGLDVKTNQMVKLMVTGAAPVKKIGGKADKEPGNPPKHSKTYDSYNFLPTNLVADSEEQRRIWAKYPWKVLGFVHGISEAFRYAEAMGGRPLGKVEVMGPAIISIDGKAKRLKKWIITNRKGDKSFVFYGQSENSVMERVEHLEKLEGRLAVIYRTDISEVSVEEFNKLFSTPIQK